MLDRLQQHIVENWKLSGRTCFACTSCPSSHRVDSNSFSVCLRKSARTATGLISCGKSGYVIS